MDHNLVLASNSPRRKQLLGLFRWPFRVQPAEIDESPLPGELPVQYVLRLAEGKARCAAEASTAGTMVLAADTTVVDRGMILGKPSGPAEAVAMLKQLRGHAHQVYTAIALVQPQDGLSLTDLCATDVPMRQYTDPEIEAYVESGDPLDKAGAYAIQHTGFKPVAQLEGCFANVMGLPLCHLARNLGRAGVAFPGSLPQDCQALLAFRCPVYDRVLNWKI